MVSGLLFIEVDMQLMPITKFIQPDLITVSKRHKYDDKYEYFKYEYSFSENICLVRRCEEDGILLLDSWEAHTEYIACKLEGDRVMYMNPKIGWSLDIIATEKYANILAEQELLK